MKRGLAALAILLLLPVALLLASPWWLPRVALPQINQQLQQYSKVPASLGSLQLQLWPLRLELGQLRLGDWQQPILAIEHASLQLEPLALAEGVLHIQQLQLGGLRSHLQLDSEGRLNLLQALHLPPPQPAAPADSSQPPALRIDQLLIDGQLQLSDQRLQQPLELTWPHLLLHVRDLDTRGGAARLWLALHGPQMPALSLRSQFDPLTRSASGHARLAALDLQPLTRYLQPMPLSLRSGRLNLDSQFSLHDGLQLHHGQLELQGLQLDEQGAGHRLQLPSLNLRNIQLDSTARHLQIGQLDSRGLITRLLRDADGRLDWQQLVQDSLAAAAPRRLPLQLQLHPAAQDSTATAPAAADSATAPAAPAASVPAAWQLVVQQLQLRDYRLALSDQSVKPAARVDIGPLNLQAGPLHADLSQPLQLQLDSAIGPRGQLAISGSLQPASRSADLQLRLSSLDLRPLQGWISPWIRVQLQAGDLDTQLAIQAAAREGEPLQLQASGSAAINQLHIKDGIEDRDLLKWQRLGLGGLQYRHGTQLQIGSIELEKPYARLVLDEQRRSNIQALLVEQSAPAATAGSASPPLHVQIGSTRVVDGTVNFADRSLTPNFSASILQLEGRIGALDNRSSQAAAIDIRGKVDRYAPVRIQGSLTPFDPLQRLDVTTSFRRVELTTLTPYSGKFAGYSIRKGRLNLDLHYRIDHGQLQADNKLVLENLQLGDRVESPDATSLPVRLAVALLKDSQGNIDIELPVAGDLNNPQFSIGPLLAQTLGNLIARAAKAPFSLLLGLAADSGSADQISFAAASTQLDEPARERLDQLASALTERPELRLEVEGLSAASLDGPLLAEARLRREYQRLWYRMQQERGARVPAEATDIQVPQQELPALLEGIYRTRLRQPPPAQWQTLRPAERFAQLQQALLQHWSDSELMLRQLAQDRAEAIKVYLVETRGLADERIYLIDVGQAEPVETQVPSRLHLSVE